MPSKNVPVNGWPQIKELDIVAPILAELDKIEAWQKSVKQETKTGAEVTFTNALALPAVSLSAEIEASQDLHGLPFPYVGGAGKNKLPMILSDIKTVNTTGTWSGNVYTINGVAVTVLTDSAGNVTGFNLNGVCTANFNFYVTAIGINLEANGMTYSGLTTGSETTYFLYWDGAGVQVNTEEVTITTGRNPITTSRIVVRANANLSNVKVYPMVRPSTITDTTFAPWENKCPISGRTTVTITDVDAESQTATVTVQLGQTVYGGSLNLTTGVMTVTHVIADMGDLTWGYNSTVHRFYATVSDGKYTGADTGLSGICSCYPVVAKDWHNLSDNEMTLGTSFISGSTSTIVVNDSAYSDASAFKTARTGQTIRYELATPTTIQLTPEQLTMLKGYNRLSSDGGGDITVTAYTGNKWN